MEARHAGETLCRTKDYVSKLGLEILSIYSKIQDVFFVYLLIFVLVKHNDFWKPMFLKSIGPLGFLFCDKEKFIYL
jgi:hypothetical protein